MTSSYEAATQMPSIGQAAPRFSLKGYPSGTFSLEDFLGKKNVILAFYPKDDTPGCTKEMCAFSSDLLEFNGADTQVLGISCDSLDSHRAFAQKFNLQQPLLADEKGEVARAYGVIGPGKSTASRVLFLIDKQGIIKHVFEGMPSNADLLDLVRKLG